MTSTMSDSGLCLGTFASGPHCPLSASSAGEWIVPSQAAAWKWLELTPERFAEVFRGAWASLLRDRPDIQVALDASPLSTLYAPFAEEDCALADAGLAEYGQLLDDE